MRGRECFSVKGIEILSTHQTVGLDPEVWLAERKKKIKEDHPRFTEADVNAVAEHQLNLQQSTLEYSRKIEAIKCGKLHKITRTEQQVLQKRHGLDESESLETPDSWISVQGLKLGFEFETPFMKATSNRGLLDEFDRTLKNVVSIGTFPAIANDSEFLEIFKVVSKDWSVLENNNEVIMIGDETQSVTFSRKYDFLIVQTKRFVRADDGTLKLYSSLENADFRQVPGGWFPHRVDYIEYWAGTDSLRESWSFEVEEARINGGLSISDVDYQIPPGTIITLHESIKDTVPIHPFETTDFLSFRKLETDPSFLLTDGSNEGDQGFLTVSELALKAFDVKKEAQETVVTVPLPDKADEESGTSPTTASTGVNSVSGVGSNPSRGASGFIMGLVFAIAGLGAITGGYLLVRKK